MTYSKLVKEQQSGQVKIEGKENYLWDIVLTVYYFCDRNNAQYLKATHKIRRRRREKNESVKLYS
jgi:hypothetical protein